MWSLFSRTSSFPYEILDVISEDDRTTWKLHKGKRKANGEEVTIFTCEGGGGATIIDLAKSAVKRLKMLKHPSILKFVDSWESDKSVYLVTEVVTPLMKWLSGAHMNSKNSSTVGLAGWGLLQITQGLSFINNDGKLLHNNINSSSVYVTQGGEWKIFGLEYTTADPSYCPVKVLPQLCVYDPPEIGSSGNRHQCNLWSVDMWGLGCLIWEVFSEQPLDKNASLQHTNKIPKSLVSTYCKLVGANPLARPNPKEVLDNLRKQGQFFNNDLIETLTFLDEIQIKDDNEKHRFFSKLNSKLDNIPDFISKNKILPALLTAHEFSNLGSVLLTPIFKIGHILEDNEYQSQIVPCVVKMFSSTDRATRLKLLQQMETLADHLDPKTVNEQLFQPLVTGFQDTNPTIREHTVKAVIFLAPKMNHHNLNVEILKHFARLQSRDDQGGIRTNTTVCLGKIASCLHPETRQKCLVSAFTRAMRDPFPPARIAGVTAIGATQQFYPLSDVATKIMPAMSSLTLDPEKVVRDAVFRIMKGFLGKLEKVSEDPDLKHVMEKEVATASSSSSSSSSWAGWAVGALASKFYKGPTSLPAPQKEGSEESSGPPPPTTTSVTEATASEPSGGRKGMQRENTWGESWTSDKDLETRSETTVSATLSDLSVSEEAGGGWGEDGEDDDAVWDSLGDLNPVAEGASAQTDLAAKLSSSSAYKWGEASGKDFFSSFHATSAQHAEKSKMDAAKAPSWNDWDDHDHDDAAPDKESKEDFSNLKVDESKMFREEKRLQRQKEIEAKRAARSGPMKLGARKF